MALASGRTLLLFLCTCATFATLGRAPGAVNLRTRDIEAAITAEGKHARAKREAAAWLSSVRPV